MSFLFNAIRFLARTVLTLAIRASRLGAGFATVLAIVWYVLYGTQLLEYVVAFGFATAVVIIAAAMMWESYRLVSTSSAFEKAKELAIPLEIALESIDFGCSTWNSEYSSILVDNVSRDARELRRLANNSNW